MKSKRKKGGETMSKTEFAREVARAAEADEEPRK